MTTDPGVRRATRADEARVTRALASAFTDDPVWGFLIPFRARNRPARLEAAMGSFVRTYLRQDKGVYLAGDGCAAALWAPPGKWKFPVSELIRETPATVRAYGTHVVSALRSLNLTEAKHPNEPEHWYLGVLGSEAGHQGKGYGSALLRVVLDDCDANQVPAYLESSNQRNHSLYYRHGFDIVEEFRLPGGGPPVWRMWRDPR